MRSTAALIVSAVLGALLAWFVMDSRHAAEVTRLQLDHQTALTKEVKAYGKALEAVHADAVRMQKEKDDAIARATQRAQANAVAAAAAAAELGRVRNDLSEAKRRLADAPVEALREYAATVGDLYGECEAELTETARAATGHASDVVLLSESWPVKGSTP